MLSLDQQANDEENQQKLANDDSRPFSPPDDAQDNIPPDDPALDTGIDSHQWYDEGREGAAGTSDQHQ